MQQQAHSCCSICAYVALLSAVLLGRWSKEYDPLVLQIKKVYLIQITEMVPRRLDLETVWMLDADSRSVQRAPVHKATQSNDPTELVLRIRQAASLQHVSCCGCLSQTCSSTTSSLSGRLLHQTCCGCGMNPGS